jgi:hypothetical protein
MSNMFQPIRVTCTFCGWKKVVRPRHSLSTPQCEQCGCNKMHHRVVGSIEELFSWVKGFFTH